MKIHEYQAKEIFARFGVPIPKGRVAFTPEEARIAAQELGAAKVVVKAQIHAGGRGKGGGVKLAHSPQEAYELAKKIIGMNLVTHQTGPAGKEVKKVLVEEGMEIERELYLGMVLDREQARPVFMASTAGGMDIEKVAAETPEKIIKEYVHPLLGLRAFQARKIAYGLELSGKLVSSAVTLLQSLYKVYLENDCSLVEINPLVVTGDGRLLALDAKINLDDSALGRHPQLKELRDLFEEEPLEVEASKFKLNYIKLDGNVGCMVNGAGLAMATMDLIKLSGQSPANFLDVGGGASVEQVENAFRILISDPHVKAVFINIFGGILRCDRLVAGFIEAARKTKIQVPIVVRLEGTNVVEARQMLAQSGLKFTVASDMKDAAVKVAEAVAGKEV